MKKIAAFAFSGSIQCNKSLDFLNEELEKIDDVQIKFDELSNELQVRTEILELQLSGTFETYSMPNIKIFQTFIQSQKIAHSK